MPKHIKTLVETGTVLLNLCSAVVLSLVLLLGCVKVYNNKPKYVMYDGVVCEVVCNGQNCRLVPHPELKEIPK